MSNCLSQDAKVPIGFENGCRGLQKLVLKLKQGFAGCERAFRIENMVLQDYNGAF